MRRLPRPQRSIDHLIPGNLPLRPSLANSPCRPTTVCLRALPNTVSPFSTTPHPLGLFSNPTKKDGKEKHQAFVRKWQKRLLGESDPVGAHVDPYDKTSPVRVAPEEQGEEEELLEEMDENATWGYTPAETARGLERIGGEKWIREFKEWENRETWAQWRARDSFVPATKITTPTKLRDAVHRAIVEVFTIRRLGIPISSMNSAVAEIPWIKNVKLQPSSSTELISIHYPGGVPVEDLVNSLLPKAPAPKAVGPDLEVLPELSEEQLLEMSEEDATSYETVRDFTQRAEAINEAVVESRELVMDAVNRQRSVSLSAALGAPKASSPETETVNKELNLSEVPLEDAELKFALVKRLTKLTGLRISDPALLDINTFAHLYTQLLIASKPKPKKLFEEIVQDSNKKRTLKIPNVKFSPRRVTVIDKEKEVGRWKVIEYALTERGIPVTRRKMKEW